jgi:glycosyltransferase involved in cell wall biosynthesis
MEHRVSVVIPTYNRAGMLEWVLPCYIKQKYVTEVIVVDDGSSDETKPLVEEMSASNPIVKYVRQPRNMGQATAKNLGCQHATGDLVFFGEDDLELDDDHVEVLVEHMATSPADVIAGRCIWLRLGESKAQGLARANRNTRPVVNTWLLEFNSHAVTPGDVQVPILQATILLWKSLLEEVHFSSDYRGGNSWREETDFHLALGQRGYKLVFCPHTVAYHHPRPSFQARQQGNRLLADLKTLYWMFKNNRYMLQKHRDYLARKNHLIGGSVFVTSVIYIIFRAMWMFKSETFRMMYLHILARLPEF